MIIQSGRWKRINKTTPSDKNCSNNFTELRMQLDFQLQKALCNHYNSPLDGSGAVIVLRNHPSIDFPSSPILHSESQGHQIPKVGSNPGQITGSSSAPHRETHNNCAAASQIDGMLLGLPEEAAELEEKT